MTPHLSNLRRIAKYLPVSDAEKLIAAALSQEAFIAAAELTLRQMNNLIPHYEGLTALQAALAACEPETKEVK